MAVRVMLICIYGLLMACFFAIGVYIPSIAGVCFVVSPFILSIIVGYISISVEEAFKIQILGLAVFGVISLAIVYVLSNFLANSLFWVYSESWPELSDVLVHGQAFDIVVGALSTILLGFFVTQIPLTISGVVIGLLGKEANRLIWPTKPHPATYGDFTSEGVTVTGVTKVRIIGTVPEDLVKWMQKVIEAGEYVNQSHVVETALKKLREAGS